MKLPVTIPVSVALSDKEYCYPSWMRSQSIASPSPPPLTCALQHFTDSLPAPIYTPKGGEGGGRGRRKEEGGRRKEEGGRRKISDTLWELSVFPKNTTE